ncbi:unnamed protein product [Bursaphelenchus okinawaensis]|uniref:Cytoplasmic tRNA 2-thiolation protein 1 n=1 Tax=Bursaphelenchus okinawaensis TaxID=465554 RepID=A0A811KUT2_9BILA|nr:unnamed protein product [Bursaphelenchus okinawaensis]CAG9111157.1 unnamed protein product [Bursaphelenchus okinawaensis]
MKCELCSERMAKVKVGKTQKLACKECFIYWFEEDVYETIKKTNIFKRGDKVAVGVSGGKDSTVLANTLDVLNKRHDLGLELILVCIDEGIAGYRDGSIEEVHKNESDLGLKLVILSYKRIYGWTMDEIVKKIGNKNNCTFCGVFRRQALDRGAMLVGAVKLVTGHNADDIAETVLLNMLRGDVPRLERCTAPMTGQEGQLPRVKPFKYTYEKDIVMYAHHRKLPYFCVDCKYSTNAHRGYARVLIKDLERERPQAILDLISSGDKIAAKEDIKAPTERRCDRCGFMSSQPICKACLLLYGLETNNLSLGISKKGKLSDKEVVELTKNKIERMAIDENRNYAGGCGSEDCGGGGCGSGIAVDF